MTFKRKQHLSLSHTRLRTLTVVIYQDTNIKRKVRTEQYGTGCVYNFGCKVRHEKCREISVLKHQESLRILEITLNTT